MMSGERVMVGVSMRKNLRSMLLGYQVLSRRAKELCVENRERARPGESRRDGGHRFAKPLSDCPQDSGAPGALAKREVGTEEPGAELQVGWLMYTGGDG